MYEFLNDAHAKGTVATNFISFEEEGKIFGLRSVFRNGVSSVEIKDLKSGKPPNKLFDLPARVISLDLMIFRKAAHIVVLSNVGGEAVVQFVNIKDSASPMKEFVLEEPADSVHFLSAIDEKVFVAVFSAKKQKVTVIEETHGDMASMRIKEDLLPFFLKRINKLPINGDLVMITRDAQQIKFEIETPRGPVVLGNVPASALAPIPGETSHL